jgi:acetyl-CoA C-acetyltransferase
MDPNTPVIIGAAQSNHRDGHAEPIDLMAQVVRAALEDTGARGVETRIKEVRVVRGIWPYEDPGALLAERLGIAEFRTALTAIGGNEVYDLVNRTATEIASGTIDAAIICSAETLRTRRGDRSSGGSSSYLPERLGARPDLSLGDQRPLSDHEQLAAGVGEAVAFYALAESALCHSLGQSVEAHRSQIAALWERANEVAVANPDAWISKRLSADEIATASASNRMVAFPYTKLMTANINVDQGAAVVMCSTSLAESLGLNRDRWVFPHAGAGAADHDLPSQRMALDASPAMRIAAGATLDLAGVSLDDIDLIDLYSCFPVAVEVAQRELSMDPARPFTVTGGLTFAGGPLNSYCLHALVTAVSALREREGSRALLTGNGGYFSKHSFALLGSDPSGLPFSCSRPQGAVDALARRDAPATTPSSGVIEATTVTYGRDQEPARAILSVLDEHGSRVWCNSRDPQTIAALLAEDVCGRRVSIDTTAEVPVALIEDS